MKEVPPTPVWLADSGFVLGAEVCWRMLRTLRSDPPGWAQSGARRATFCAALAQSEDLWRAGIGLTADTSPIVLYYSLCQGARALLAACLKADRWEGLPGHGVSLQPKPGCSPDKPTLDCYLVAPDGRGFLSVVAELVNSPVLAGPVDLVTLACSLPQYEEFGLTAEDRPYPLIVSLLDSRAKKDQQVPLVIGPLPNRLVAHEVKPSPLGGEVRTVLRPSTNEIAEWLKSYPSLAALGMPLEIEYVNPDIRRLDWYGVCVVWNLKKTMDSYGQHEWLQTVLDVFDPPQVAGGLPSSGLVLPTIAGNSRPQAPLVGWWLLLYAFSMMARYHPRQWTRLLDLDRSIQAVPVQSILATAAQAIPELLAYSILHTCDDE